jgi:protease IV
VSRRFLISAAVVGLVVVMTIAGLALAMSRAGAAGGLGLGGRIAVVEVDGIIGDDDRFLRDVQRLRRNRSVRGWVVAINSPGGIVAPSQSMYETLRRIRVEDAMPVVASIGSVGASGGYYVALAADSIVALPGSITGSIGVLMEYPNVRVLMEKLGVRMDVVKGGEQKDLLSPFREMEPEQREIVEALVRDVHEQFIEVVMAERGLSAEEVLRLADGRIVSGRQAHALGLVDRLGNREDAIAIAGRMAGLGSRPDLVRPPEPRRPFLIDLLFGPTVGGAVQKLAGSVVQGGWPTLKYIVH